MFIDVNGEYIYINDPNNGEKYRYHNGETQKQVDGEWVSAKNDYLSDFVVATITGLRDLETKGFKNGIGKGLIDKFSGDKKDVTFQYREVKGNFGNEADWSTSTVFFDHNYDQVAHTTSGDISTPHFVIIGHEMSHLTDPVKFHVPWFGQVSQSEIRATHYENLIRAESGLPLRTHYSSYMEGGKLLPDPRSTIIDKSGNSVYFSSPTRMHPGNIPTLIEEGKKANGGIILKARFNYLEYGKR